MFVRVYIFVAPFQNANCVWFLGEGASKVQGIKKILLLLVRLLGELLSQTFSRFATCLSPVVVLFLPETTSIALCRSVPPSSPLSICPSMFHTALLTYQHYKTGLFILFAQESRLCSSLRLYPRRLKYGPAHR